MPNRFPFPPIRLVMETIPGTCNFYSQTDYCSRFSNDQDFEPEYHVKEVIASFLTGCHFRACPVVEFGANNGWFTSYMLSLGATVLAVEPQSDFAQAVRDTAALNGWSHRALILAALVATNRARVGTGYQRVKTGYRAGGFPPGLKLPAVPVVPMDTLLLGEGYANVQSHFAASSNGDLNPQQILCRLHKFCLNGTWPSMAPEYTFMRLMWMGQKESG